MATKDRFVELQEEISKNESNGKKKKNKASTTKIEESAFSKFEVIREWINAIAENTQKCRDVHANNTRSKNLHKKLQEVFKNSETLSYNIATTLKKINQSLNESEDKSSAEFRMRLIQYTGLVNRFKEVVEEQETWTQRIHDSEKYFINKCRQIVNHEELDDDQLNRLIGENPQIFTQDYIQNELEARRQLADIETRHKELLVLEQHLLEIRDLFVQISTLVELQQESLNRVEFFAATATDHVDRAVDDLEGARKSKRRGRKLKIFIAIGVIVIAIIIIVSILC